MPPNKLDATRNQPKIANKNDSRPLGQPPRPTCLLLQKLVLSLHFGELGLKQVEGSDGLTPCDLWVGYPAGRTTNFVG